MKWENLLVFLVFTGILISGLASAAFDVDEDASEIEENAFAGDFVDGTVVINFSNQWNAEFNSNFQGGIELLELLEKMGYVAGQDFTCEPRSCTSDYSFGTGESSKSFELGSEKETYGFVILDNGIVSAIKKFDFKVRVDGIESCENQLYIDLFNDRTVDYYNTVTAEDKVCGVRNNGCFNGDATTTDAQLSSTNYYCEKIFLGAAPDYRIGAVLTGNSGGGIRFSLYSLSGQFLGYCDDSVGGSAGGDYCDIGYSSQNESFTAFVCARAKSSEDTYMIKKETSGQVCGGATNNPQYGLNLDMDFEIYGQKLKYADVGHFWFEEKYVGSNLLSAVNSYISETYSSNCSNGCVIPLGIYGIEGQTITLEEVDIDYDVGFVTNNINQVYQLQEQPFEISSSEYLSLDVEKMELIVPDDEGSEIFNLRLGTENVLSETLDIEVGFEFGISPRLALIGQSTWFKAFSIEEDIASSEWDFGDNTVIISESNTAQHTYDEEGEYTVSVDVVASDGSISKKRFKVIVGEARASANLTLTTSLSRISGMRNDVNGFPEWIQDEIEEEINLTFLEASVNGIKSDFEALGSSASTDDYVDIINDLLALDIPRDISVTESGTLPAAIGFDNMNVQHIISLSGNTNVTDNQDLKNTIINWMNENYDIDIEFEIVSALKDGGSEVILKKYKIKLTRKATASNLVSYLIIGQPQGALNFNTAGAESVSGGSAVDFRISESGSPSSIEFSIAGASALEVANLGVYISPALSQLGSGGKRYTGIAEQGEFDWNHFLIWMTILVVVVFVVYLLLQAWYKRYYEKHLFRNPNDLYNIVNFIYNSRRVGLRNGDIRKRLREKKWKGEQITYAFKKIDGKRTGMWEIPIFKFLENRKVKKEIQKKQGGRPIDVRFIKRPALY